MGTAGRGEADPRGAEAGRDTQASEEGRAVPSQACRETHAAYALGEQSGPLRLTLLAVGTRLPEWARAACDDYTRRLQSRLPITLVEIPAGRRSASQPIDRAMADEAKRLLAVVRPKDHLALLDERGSTHDSATFSAWLAARMRAGDDLVLALGGADGFAADVRARAHESLSLSRMTLPHALARVVVVEQLYRAVTLMDGHPYHRE